MMQVTERERESQGAAANRSSFTVLLRSLWSQRGPAPATGCAPDIIQVLPPDWRSAKALLPLHHCANFSVIHFSSVLNNAINVTLMSSTQFTAPLPVCLLL